MSTPTTAPLVVTVLVQVADGEPIPVGEATVDVPVTATADGTITVSDDQATDTLRQAVTVALDSVQLAQGDDTA